MTKEIQLTQGQVTLVDDDDFEYLNQHKWYAAFDKHTKTFRAQRVSSKSLGKRKTEVMPIVIMGASTGYVVDHIDRNTLNNQRSNLRVCTNAENARNCKKKRTSTSNYKGVVKKKNKWQARIYLNRKLICLGHFSTDKEAAKAYDDAAEKYYGEFARKNL